MITKNKKNNKYFISLPYIYPICPLNMNHARLFIIADVVARYFRNKGKKVFFPIASHYSGKTAHQISQIFNQIYNSKRKPTKEEEKYLNLYKNFYGVPDYILKWFNNPINILDFFTQEIIWELKSLNVSCDYKNFYTTYSKDFHEFVKSIIGIYKKNNLLIINKDDKPALDYENKLWELKAFKLLKRIEFIQPFHKNNILSAFINKNVRSDWSLVKESGYGVKFDKKHVIDPMFDSELFTIFDLYSKFQNEYQIPIKNFQIFFNTLFEMLKNPKLDTDNILVKKIIEWLPCDMFIVEEHLKNWIIKKIYSEALFLNEKYQTKKYFILGMGLLDGKRMSASRGHAILGKDLIFSYGPTKARLIILLAGGHPSKTYNYDKSLPNQVDVLLRNFLSYVTYIISIIKKTRKTTFRSKKEIVNSISNNIEKNIKNGYFKQAIIELFSIIPKNYKSVDFDLAKSLLLIFKKYTEILTPGVLDNFNL